MSYNISEVNSGYVALTAGGLAGGTTTGTYKTVNTIAFTNNGIFKSKGGSDNLTFSTGHTALAAGQACLFAVWLNASGTASTTQGPIVASGDPCPVPGQVTAGTTLIGLIKVVATATFTPGTTALGTGNTATYFDCMTMPGSAQ